VFTTGQTRPAVQCSRFAGRGVGTYNEHMPGGRPGSSRPVQRGGHGLSSILRTARSVGPQNRRINMSDPSILLIPPLPANCCRLLQTLSDRQGVLSCSEWPVDRAVNICLTYNLIRLRSVVGVRESDRKADGPRQPGACRSRASRKVGPTAKRKFNVFAERFGGAIRITRRESSQGIGAMAC